MKRRPTEIPYIPKDKRRSRFAPREGGTIIASSKGVEALRQTNAEAWGKRDKRKNQGGCGCLLLIFLGWSLFAGDLQSYVQGLVDDYWPDEIEVRDEPINKDLPILDVPVPMPGDEVATLPPTPGNARAPVADLRGLITSEDYPPQSLAQGEEGTVRAQPSLDADGRATDCQIVGSSGHDRLDQRTCTLLRQRARFAPALDGDGNPVPSLYTAPPIRWQIEG